mmetsp:Transcript_21869/g.75666  ORF Transcript_21869/g.75666 Transcript_21869/m.75666 type:complete len:85 (+) Transcript_21869:3932-4186(+)
MGDAAADCLFESMDVELPLRGLVGCGGDSIAPAGAPTGAARLPTNDSAFRKDARVESETNFWCTSATLQEKSSTADSVLVAKYL